MDFKEYQELAKVTAFYGAGTKILYPALGLGNEVGEVLGKIKKVLRDNEGNFTEELKNKIGDEIGDSLWYMCMLATDLNLDMNQIAQNNLTKLEDRRNRGVIQGSGDYR